MRSKLSSNLLKNELLSRTNRRPDALSHSLTFVIYLMRTARNGLKYQLFHLFIHLFPCVNRLHADAKNLRRLSMRVSFFQIFYNPNAQIFPVNWHSILFHFILHLFVYSYLEIDIDKKLENTNIFSDLLISIFVVK